MGLRRDDRGQAIQVGAAILLGFVVITITLYQVQVVPSQNAEIEFDHNMAVQDDVQDLRNAITNAGARVHSESVSLTLGTGFPARTIFVNPPPATGTLQTVDAGNVTFGNAQVAEDAAFGADAEALLTEEHETSRIEYTPNYREYQGGPTTAIEHSLAYNRFHDGGTLPLSRQTVVRGDRLAITLVDGDLQEQHARSVTVEAETASGPTDRIPIEPVDSDQPIELTFVVDSAEQWNESIGETYADGQTDARVEAYDDDTGELTLFLDRPEYQLQMALVGVTDGVEQTDRYDVHGAGGGAEHRGTAYAVDWAEDDVTVAVGTDSRTFTAEIDPDGIDGADVDFSYRDPDGVGISEGPMTDEEFSDGTATFDVEGFDGPGTVDLFVSSGGSSDVLTVDVVGGFLVEITGANDPVQEGEPLNVTADVEHSSDEPETQDVELLIDDVVVDETEITLDPGETETVTLTWQTEEGDAGEYDAVVRTEDDEDQIEVTVTEEGAVTLAHRIDDLGNQNGDVVDYRVSAVVTGAGEDFDRIEVSFDNLDNDWADADDTIDQERGSVTHGQGEFGDEFEITIQAIEMVDGDAVVVAETTVVDEVDSFNPDGNDDLSRAESPQFLEGEPSIDDTSNPGQGPRFQVGYEVDPGTEFDRVEAVATGLEGGGIDSDQSQATADTFELNADGSGGDEFVIAVLVWDDDGVVVDAHRTVETADF